MNLAQEDKAEKAAKVLALCDEELPATNVPHDFQSGSLDMARTYAAIGNKAKAKEIVKQLWDKSNQYIQYYCSLSPSRFSGSQRDCMLHIYILEHLTQIASQIDEKLGNEYESKLDAALNRFQEKGGNLGF